MTAPSIQKGFEKILTCVAEGAASDHALRASLALAQRFGSELELLHVVPPLYTAGVHLGGITSEALSHSRADTVRDTLRAHLAHRHAGLTWQGVPVAEALRVAVGSPARVVLERVRERGIDLIVLGDSGKRKQLDLGGLARSLFSRALCPVWMQVEPPREIERILVPVDLSDSSKAVLSRAVGLAKSFNARIHVLECFASPELFYGAGLDVPSGPLPYTLDSLRNVERDAFGAFVESFDWRGVDHAAEFVDDDPARAILSTQDRYDLIVMGTHGRSALAAALLGSVTWQVLRLARTPVLTVRDDRQAYAF